MGIPLTLSLSPRWGEGRVGGALVKKLNALVMSLSSQAVRDKILLGFALNFEFSALSY